MQNETVIAVMAKQPLAGKTKTRLCPPLTPQQAAALYEALMLDTFALAGSIAGADLAVAITPPESRAYFESIVPPRTLLLPVEGRNIGDCLAQTLAELLRLGYRKALALNSDGPSLPSEALVKAILLLDTNDLVLGPSEDGGYYLIGAKQFYPALFSGITWSTDRVLAQTLEQAARMRLSIALCPLWYDIDMPADLPRLVKEMQQAASPRLEHTRRILANISPEPS